MTTDTLLLALFTIFFSGLVIYAFVTGRTTRATRREDPAGYWLAIAALAVTATLSCWLLARAVAGGRPGHFTASLFFAPYCLYLVVDWLRTGEIVFGNNRFPRRGRAQPYWTILLLGTVLFVFFAAILVHDAMRGRY